MTMISQSGWRRYDCRDWRQACNSRRVFQFTMMTETRIDGGGVEWVSGFSSGGFPDCLVVIGGYLGEGEMVYGILAAGLAHLSGAFGGVF